MTWHASTGDRCLTESESRLLREAVDFMHDMIASEVEDGGDVSTYDIPEFDNLTAGQKIALLEQVLRQLVTVTETLPKLTAVNESAIAAMYAAVGEMVGCEIDMQSFPDDVDESEPSFWRNLLLDVVRDDEGDLGELPAPDGSDMDEWEYLLDVVRSRILWDIDFMGVETVLDVVPPIAHQHREMLGIERDYFIAVPPDPKESELPGLRQRLRELCRP